MKSKVYFTDMHTTLNEGLPKKLEKLMKKAGFEKIDFRNKFAAVKLHFGEPGNLAFLRPNYAKVVCDYIKRLGGKPLDRKSTRLNSSHSGESRMPSSA